MWGEPMAKSKKIVLFIVEGPFDQFALDEIVGGIVESETVKFHIIEGDLTAFWENESTNIKAKIYKKIEEFRDRYGYKKSDILRVVQLLDTDGAYIPDNCVIQGTSKISYKENCIETSNVQGIQRRNYKKRTISRMLATTSCIGSYPYEVFYFSRNLEHALHNDANELTDDQKGAYADQFALAYKDDIEGFIKYINDETFAVQKPFSESWEFIFSEKNSLHRHCNFHICINQLFNKTE